MKKNNNIDTKQEKKDKSGSSFMKNVAILMGSHLLIKILGFIYRLVITNVEGFGDTGNGYYSAGYIIYSILLTLSSTGIPSVVSKMVSERLATGDRVGAQRVFKVALKFFAILGIVFSFALFFGADAIAIHILNVPGTAYVMRVLAPAIVFVSIASVIRGYFSGQQNMKPIGISQTLEQFLNCVLSITFVYACIGKDAYIMAAAGNLSTTLSVIIAFIYIVMYYKNNKIDTNQEFESPEAIKSDKEILRTVLAIAIPITIGSIISVISSFIDTVTISNCIQIAYQNTGLLKAELEELAMTKSGILSKIDPFVTFPISINTAFATALVPVISESIAKKDFITAKKRMSFSIFASILIILPCAMGFFVLADSILKMFFPTVSDGALVFQLSTIPMIFIALSNTISGGLYGLNLSKVPAISLGIGIVVKTILNIILISNPDINIVGAVIGSIACQIISFSICYTILKGKLELKIDKVKVLVKPIVSTIIMGICVWMSYHFLSGLVGNTISTVISIAIGAIIYVISILLLKVLSKEEFSMIPFGNKIYGLLQKMKLY